MEKILLVIFGILFVFTGLGYSMGERPTKVEDLSNNVEVIELKVEGISCPSCVPIIKNALQKVPGVKKAEVNLQGKAKVYTEKSQVNPFNLVQAVEKAGYKATLAK